MKARHYFNIILTRYHTVNILTMHNTGPQLFLCIVTFYARQNVSQSVTICDLCQKCHMYRKLGSTAYLHGINIHGREITTEKRIERSLSDWAHLNNVGLCPSWGISRHLSIPQIHNFGQLHMIHPKWMLAVNLANLGMEKCWKFWLQYTKSTMSIG